MPAPVVTIVVTHRDRFSIAEESLASLYETADVPFRLIYVDSGSPPSLKRSLEEAARKRGFKLIRKEKLVYPNEARNLAMPEIRTRYVVFVDNDLIFERGWLGRLVACAEETGASVVGPLTYNGTSIPNRVIHLAGADISLASLPDGRCTYKVAQRLVGQRATTAILSELKRERVDSVEIHCLLARTDLLEKVGGWDPSLFTLNEHVDLCLAAKDHGCSVYFEPGSVVTFLEVRYRLADLVSFRGLAWADIRCQRFRWKSRKTIDTYRHFDKKWSIDTNRESLFWLLRYPFRDLPWLLRWCGSMAVWAYRTLDGSLASFVKVPADLKWTRLRPELTMAADTARIRHESLP